MEELDEWVKKTRAQMEKESVKTRVEQVEKKIRKVKQILETPPGVPVIEDIKIEDIIRAESELEEKETLLVALESALLKERADRLRKKIQVNEKRILPLEREIEMVQKDLSLIDKDKDKEQKEVLEEALEGEIEAMELELERLKKPQEKLKDLEEEINRLPETSVVVSKKVKEMDDKEIQDLIQGIRKLQEEIKKTQGSFSIFSTLSEELKEEMVFSVMKELLQATFQKKAVLEEGCQYLFSILFGKTEELDKEEQKEIQRLKEDWLDGDWLDGERQKTMWKKIRGIID